MCGLTGFWQDASQNAAEMAKITQSMADTIIHRGPDDAGVWVDAAAGLAFGFRRLAILELSPLGHQPMVSESGRYVVVFNGEIYNFQILRTILAETGHRFRGGSDTEVILAATEEWGFDKALRRFNGMFAIALWDRQNRTLTLARDALGIKPLYYGWSGDTLLFGSELKAFRAHPAFRPEVDRGALTLYMRHGYVPGPYSIYQDVFKLLPGCVVTFRAPTERGEPKSFWSLKEITERGTAEPCGDSEEEVLDELHNLLSHSVKQQMVADVPLGAFLSGGIDSSLVVALMQAQSSRPVQTFSIGFHEEKFDEAPYARAVAQHLGTAHTEMYVTPAQAQGIIPKLPEIYDEPFADASNIPTSLLCALTRNHVTVSLSGDGGDELFGGYNHYWTSRSNWRHINAVPRCFRYAMSRSMNSLGRLLEGMSLGPVSRLSSSLLWRAPYFSAMDTDDFIRLRLTYWRDAVLLVRGGYEPVYLLGLTAGWPKLHRFEQRFMFVDTAMGLPDDMLTKVDRASSAVGLEARVPLLDQRVVEFAWRLPPRFKVKSTGKGKWALRCLLRRYLPPQLFERPKQGFGVPIARWLRGPLRDWAEELLDGQRLRNEGFLDPVPVRRRWAHLLDSTFDWEANLWLVLMFQAWKQRWLP